jgi:type III pantothenate kinase
MLILAIDIGNTRIKWGLSSDTNWLKKGATPCNEHSVLASQWKKLPAPEYIIISSVASPETTAQVIQHCQSQPHLITPQAEQYGVKNGYETPSQLGSDRWAALIGARHLFPGRDLLVVQSGTATTIDTLDAEGFFPGGLILPGLQLMRQALTQGTAKLEHGALEHGIGALEIYPRNTADAIQSGSLNAIVGAIERRFKLLKHAPLCLLSGGDADILLPLLAIPTQRVDDLVLEGLIQIAQEGTK